MRILSKLVFDEELSGSGPFFTNQQLNELLGRYDQVSIQAIVDKANTSGSLTVHLQHSADGRNFADKYATAEIAGVGAGPGYGTIVTGTTNICTGSDSGSSPSLGYVRLSIALVTTTSAHVKIHLTLRDQGGAGPSQPTAALAAGNGEASPGGGNAPSM